MISDSDDDEDDDDEAPSKRKKVTSKSEKASKAPPWSPEETEALLAFVKECLGDEFSKDTTEHYFWNDLEDKWEDLGEKYGFCTTRTRHAMAAHHQHLRKQGGRDESTFFWTQKETEVVLAFVEKKKGDKLAPVTGSDEIWKQLVKKWDGLVEEAGFKSSQVPSASGFHYSHTKLRKEAGRTDSAVFWSDAEAEALKSFVGASEGDEYAACGPSDDVWVKLEKQWKRLGKENGFCTDRSPSTLYKKHCQLRKAAGRKMLKGRPHKANTATTSTKKAPTAKSTSTTTSTAPKARAPAPAAAIPTGPR